MTGKKVEFSKKPSRQNTENFIDDWVSGEKKVLSHLLGKYLETVRILDFRHYDAMSVLKFSKA